MSPNTTGDCIPSRLLIKGRKVITPSAVPSFLIPTTPPVIMKLKKDLIEQILVFELTQVDLRDSFPDEAELLGH
jgi:hypothetical protein